MALKENHLMQALLDRLEANGDRCRWPDCDRFARSCIPTPGKIKTAGVTFRIFPRPIREPLLPASKLTAPVLASVGAAAASGPRGRQAGSSGRLHERGPS